MNIVKSRPFWAYLLIFLFTQILSAVCAVIVSRLNLISGLDPINTSAYALFIANALAVLLFLCYRPQAVNWQRTINGVRGSNLPKTIWVFLLAIPVILLINLIQELFFPDLPNIVSDDMMRVIMDNPAGLITISVLGPLAEEMLIRGGVQNDMYRRCAVQGWQVAVGLSAGIFALIHMNPAQMPAAFVLGLLLGYAYWWTGSLIAPVAIHVFNNSTACLMFKMAPEDETFVEFLGGRTGAGITIVICIFFMYFIIRQIRSMQ